MTNSAQLAAISPTTRHDIVCLGCGCLCDDINVEVRDGQIAQLQHACPLGEAWFRQPLPNAAASSPNCWIDGRPASRAEAIAQAAKILTAAQYPLVCGLAHETCEAQSAASAIADRIGGVIDHTADDGDAAAVLALLQAGQASCTLGEMRQRSQTIVFWNCDPARTHPRHFERYSLDAPSESFEGPRRCIVISSTPDNLTAARASLHFPIKPHSDYACFTVLRALRKNIALDAATVLRQTDVPLDRWAELAHEMRAAHYGAIVYGGGLTDTPDARPALQALFAWVRELQIETRCVCLGLRGAGNGLGAENVLASRTGYPLAVDHTQQYPRFGPHHWQTQQLLARGEVDAALAVGEVAVADYSEAAQAHWQSIPRVEMTCRADAEPPAHGVLFRTAIAGLQSRGSTCRMDDVLLPLRPPLATTLPSATVILEQLLKAILK